MTAYETILSKQEKKWILERRVTRLSDNREAQIYPMGAERYLSSILFGNITERYDLCSDIREKNVLVIPGYANSSFLFAQAGAKSVTAYDKDPVTIAWMKAFKKYYYYREKNDKKNPSIGELMTALNYWYPQLIRLPKKKTTHFLLWIIHPNSLRKHYIHYMLSLVQNAIQEGIENHFELNKNIDFHVGSVDKIRSKQQTFDTVFVPYLLGVTNGIEKEKDIVVFIKQLLQIVPKGHIIVTPSKNTKEHYIMGKSYFVTTRYSSILDIPGLKPYILGEDKYWFRTQGVALFRGPVEEPPMDSFL